MRFKKIVALCLSLALVLLCGISTAMADEETSTAPGGSGTPEPPQVTVTGVNVTGTEYFELGVKVKTSSFQSVGLTLAYNTKVLQPVTWNDGSDVTVSGASWNDPTVLMTKGADQLSGKPALAYQPEAAEGSDAYAYVYLGANALQYTALESEDGEQVVTLRFLRLKNSDDTLKTVTMGASDDHSNTVELAPVEIAEDSIAGYQAIVSTNADTYYTQGPSNDPTSDWHVTFGEVTTGPGIGTTTTPGSSGDYAITFFDWDGRVIDAIAAEQNAAAAVSGFESNYATRLQKAGYEFDGWLVVYENNDGEGLKTKGGTLTSNKEKLPASTSDLANLEDLSLYVKDDAPYKSVLLQAAYYAVPGKVNNGNAAGVNADFNHPDARYQLVEQTYYQYGSTDGVSLGQYAVRCKVQRASALRADEPVIMALVYLASGEYLTERVDLENTDNTEFEIVVPRGVTSVAYQVLDVYEQTNWTLSVSRSEELRPKQADILREGAFALIVDEAITGTLTTGGSSVNLACFTDSGLTGVTAGNLNAKKQALVNATAAKNTGKPQSEWVALTRTEAQNALR